MAALASESSFDPPPGPSGASTPAPDPYSSPNQIPLLAALVVAHFFNDFCMGVTTPMIPSLQAKFGQTLGQVATVITLMAIFGNFSQPLAGWVCDRSRTARMLLIIPVISGLSLLVGWTTAPWQAQLLFIVAGIAVGAFHPYSLILAQRTLPRRPAMATAIFISSGFVGISFGAMISGMWMEARQFAGFHYLYLTVAVVIGAHLISRTQRLRLADFRTRKDSRPLRAVEVHPARLTIPFPLLYILALLLAIEGGSLLFFTPTLFKSLYGSEGLGGKANFLFGVLGGLSSFYFAHLCDRGNTYKVALGVQFFAVFPMLGYFYVDQAMWKMLMMGLVGLTVGGTFPMMTSLAREARGLSIGLRSSLALGGVWGVASLLSLSMAQLTDHGYDLQTVMSVVCLAPAALIPLLAYASKRYAS